MSSPDTIKRALLRYLPFTPAILLAVLLPQYWVNVPQFDEWDSVMLFEHLSQGSLTIGLLFQQVNEYRQFFPNVIFVALGKLTHWDLRYEMIVIFIAVCVIALNVRRLAIATTEAAGAQLALLLFAGNLVIFSLTQYENWFQGQQIVYYSTILCVTICILVARSGWGTTAKFAICAGVSFISMFSTVNGVVCWVVILPMLVFMEWPANRRLVIWLSFAWIIALGLCVALYFYGFEKPWWTPSPTTALHHPWRGLIYLLGFIGGPLGLERARLSIAAGALMTAVIVAVCVYLAARRHDRILIERSIAWLAIAAYSLVTAVLTTIGRVGLPTGPAQVPRYVGFSVYLLLALIFLVYIIGDDIARRRARVYKLGMHPMAVVTVAVLIFSQPFQYALSYRQMDAWQTRLLQAKASILLINQLPDSRLTKILYPNLQFLTDKSNALDGLGLLHPSLIKSKYLNDFGSETPGDFGEMLPAIEKTADGYAVSGFTTLNGSRVPEAIILAYDTGDKNPVAFAMSHPVKRPASIFKGVARFGSWTVRFSPQQLPPSPVTLTAWAFDANTGRAFRLRSSVRIDKAR